MLAYRFEPSDAAQEAHVEQHFPALSFAGRQSTLEVHIDYAKVVCPDWERPLRFDDSESANVVEVMLKSSSSSRRRAAACWPRSSPSR